MRGGGVVDTRKYRGDNPLIDSMMLMRMTIQVVIIVNWKGKYIHSDMCCDVHCDVYSDVCSDMYSDVHCDEHSGIYSDMHSGMYNDLYCDVHSNMYTIIYVQLCML